MSEHNTKDHPVITRQTLQSAITELVSQYGSDQRRRQVIPEAVYLDLLPDYDDFFAKFLVPNQLCILSERATSQWRSRREWVCQDGSPNFDFLRQTFGEATVPVADCKCKEFSAHAKQEMKMSEFLTYWQRLREEGHPSGQESLYLKDWHFTRAFPNYEAYSTCRYFRSDWMNEFWDEREDSEDDYRFVYMGPKGTWTPFHSDVFRSFSWSANICGRKKWIFFPPGEEEHLKDVYGNPAYDVMSEELKDPQKFPDAHRVQHRIEIIQQPGETIFVPSGWHHQVHNLEDTISINHNWLNGCNVRRSWLHLVASLEDVQREIGEFSDMEGWDLQCQRILKALSGLDVAEFLRFMQSIARRRMRALNTWKTRSMKNQNFHATQSADSGRKEERIIGSADVENKNFVNADDMKKAHGGTSTDPHTALSSSDHSKDTGDTFSKTTTHCQENPSQTSTDNASSKRKHTDESSQSENRFEGSKEHFPQISQDTQSENNLSDSTALSQQMQDAGISTPYTQAATARETHNTEQDDQYSVLLDLSQHSCKETGSQFLPLRPHWGVCNVHHALFDLVSVALLLKYIAETDTSGSIGIMPENKESECNPSNLTCASSQGETATGECVGKRDARDEPKLAAGQDYSEEKEEFEDIAGALSKSLSLAGHPGKGENPSVQAGTIREGVSRNCKDEEGMGASDSVSSSEATELADRRESAVDIDSLLRDISQTLQKFDITGIFDC